jgi:hypothetical protein
MLLAIKLTPKTARSAFLIQFAAFPWRHMWEKEWAP